MIAHRLETLKYCDSVITIENGKYKLVYKKIMKINLQLIDY